MRRSGRRIRFRTAAPLALGEKELSHSADIGLENAPRKMRNPRSEPAPGKLELGNDISKAARYSLFTLAELADNIMVSTEVQGEIMMTLTKTFTVALAAAIAIALSPLPELSAAPSGRGGTQFKSDLVQAAQARKKVKKKKRAKRKGKKAAVAGKSCGTFKYRKGGKCVDARDKK